MGDDLSSTDIRFLRVIRDINTNPSQYEHTESGEAPANTTAIRKASDFSRNQINYRLGSDRGRNLGEDGLNVLKLHRAKIDEETGGFGPKSVELTSKGLDILSEYSRGGVVSPGTNEGGGEVDTGGETVKQLRARIKALEESGGGGNVDANGLGSEVQSNAEAIERIESKLDQIATELRTLNESEWGGIDESKVENLDRVLERAPSMMYAFTILLEIDIDEITDVGGYSEDEIDMIRRNLLTLLESSNEDDVVSETDSGSDSEYEVDTVDQGGPESTRELPPPSFADDVN